MPKAPRRANQQSGPNRSHVPLQKRRGWATPRQPNSSTGPRNSMKPIRAKAEPRLSNGNGSVSVPFTKAPAAKVNGAPRSAETRPTRLNIAKERGA